jgi:hypothetical protein
MTDTVKSILDRIKNLNEFEIETELPNGFMFHGSVPYDIKINENKATFKLYALNTEEAVEKVNQYINENTEY